MEHLGKLEKIEMSQPDTAIHLDAMTGQTFATDRVTVPDAIYCRDAAKHLEFNLKMYWWKMGYDIQTTLSSLVMKQGEGSQRIIYELRSNLENGLPRDWDGPREAIVK